MMAYHKRRYGLAWTMTAVFALLALTAGTASATESVSSTSEITADESGSSADGESERNEEAREARDRDRCGHERTRCGHETDAEPISVHLEDNPTVTAGEFNETDHLLNRLRRQQQAAERCYRMVLDDEPDTEGLAKFELTIDERDNLGEIAAFEVVESTVSSDVADCVARQIGNRVGPIPAPENDEEGEQTATIEVTFGFSQNSD